LQHALDFASEQLTQTATTITATQYPSTTLDDYSDWITTGASSWTSGFFPGCLWYMYEYTGDASYRTWAESWMVDLEGQAANTTTHDLGFMILDSFGNGYRLTNNTAYKDVVLQAAGSLASRFNPTVGCTRSEDWGSWAFPVNIDNMMNLELLFWGAKNGVLPAWYDMAVSHAYRTMQDHVRADGSTYQFVDYDIATGDIIEKSTWGGYDVESTWSRGQAWGLYGFTVAYRETGDPNFLNTAIKVADYFVDNLPADYVPYWDFDAPTIPHTAKDASAAAIAASGLIELSTLVQAPLLSEKYSNAARNILTSLSTLESLGGYLAQDIDGNALSPGILMHGCDMHPDSHAGGDRPDRSQIYADYYFLEALLRFEGIKVP
ncbi:MAG: glucuronyl hydrolase, partial [Planctomycetes bacterium]|nr:glucuronyl hydrolase [Planctomycetota bacterium]